MSTKKGASRVWDSKVTYGICCAIIILCAVVLWSCAPESQDDSQGGNQEEWNTIRYQVTKGIKKGSVRIWRRQKGEYEADTYQSYTYQFSHPNQSPDPRHKNFLDMNNTLIEVYDTNKIRVAVGSDIAIIPVSEKPIVIDRIEPIHINPGHDRIRTLIVKVSYKSATAQEPAQEQ